MFEEKTVVSKYIYKGKILNLRYDSVKLPNGKSAGREIVEHKGAVAIIAAVDKSILMVKQYRKAVEEELLEIPAGKIENDEPADDCALRELKEETGYVAKKENISKIYEFYTSPGFSDEKMYLFYAHDLIQDKPDLDEDEFITVDKIQPDKLNALLNSGRIKDAKTIIAVQYYLKLLKDRKL